MKKVFIVMLLSILMFLACGERIPTMVDNQDGIDKIIQSSNADREIVIADGQITFRNSEGGSVVLYGYQVAGVNYIYCPGAINLVALTAANIRTTILYANSIHERSSGYGVTAEGILLKSGYVIPGTGYKSSDGAIGMNTIRNWIDVEGNMHKTTVKNGLITSWTIGTD